MEKIFKFLFLNVPTNYRFSEGKWLKEKKSYRAKLSLYYQLKYWWSYTKNWWKGYGSPPKIVIASCIVEMNDEETFIRVQGRGNLIVNLNEIELKTKGYIYE